MSKNEPETLCVAWLSSCQQFTLIQDVYMVAVQSAVRSLDKEEKKLLDKFARYLIDNQPSKGKKLRWKFNRFTKKVMKFKSKKFKINIIVEKLLNSVKFISARPIVGAIAVKYPHNNSFSVFIGIAMGEDEDNDISYIKSMGQRTTEIIARGIFPQFNDMKYHS